MNVPSIEERVVYERLPNGLDCYLLKTPVNDIVTLMLALPGGMFATYKKQTVAALLDDLLPGATSKLSRQMVHERFDDFGARTSVHSSGTHMIVRLSCRSTVFVPAFRLLIDTLTDAQFTSGEYAESKERLLGMLIHSKDDTSMQAEVALSHLLFAEGHPHWQKSTDALVREVRSVEKRDVEMFFRGTLSAVGSLLTVAGDIDAQLLLKELRSILSAVPSQAPMLVPKVQVSQTLEPKGDDSVVPIRDKMNVDTYLAIPLTLTRESDDFLALQVGVQVLGGSSTARLINTLRTKKSLTYGAYARLAGFDDGYPGYVRARAIFPNDVFSRARTEMRTVVEEFVAKGVTDKELAARKEAVAGQHKVGLSTTDGICGALFNTLLNGRPLSYVDAYPTLVAALTRRHVNTAIHSHLNYSLAVTSASGAVDEEGKPIA